MLSVNNRFQTSTPLAAAQAEAKTEDIIPKDGSLTQSMDTVTISQRPHEPEIDRPVNFVNNFAYTTSVETDLFIQLRNRIPAMFHEYMKGNLDEGSVLKTLDKAVSDMVEYYGGKGFDPADITQDILKDLDLLTKAKIQPKPAADLAEQEIWR